MLMERDALNSSEFCLTYHISELLARASSVRTLPTGELAPLSQKNGPRSTSSDVRLLKSHASIVAIPEGGSLDGEREKMMITCTVGREAYIKSLRFSAKDDDSTLHVHRS